MVSRVAALREVQQWAGWAETPRVAQHDVASFFRRFFITIMRLDYVWLMLRAFMEGEKITLLIWQPIRWFIYSFIFKWKHLFEVDCTPIWHRYDSRKAHRGFLNFFLINCYTGSCCCFDFYKIPNIQCILRHTVQHVEPPFINNKRNNSSNLVCRATAAACRGLCKNKALPVWPLTLPGERLTVQSKSFSP